MRRLLPLLLALLTATVVAVGCGDSGGGSSAAAEAVPAGALMYGEVTLNPEGDQRRALDSIASKFPGEGGAGERIRALIEKGLDESDAPVSFSKDIEPWLGDEAAFFLSSLREDGEGEGAALVATDDEEAAIEAVKKVAAKSGEKYRSANYKDHEYLAIDKAAVGTVDGWLVFGTPAGFKAVVDTADGDENLQDDEEYQNALEGAADDRLGLFYLNSPGLFEQLQKSEAGAALGQFRDLFNDPYVATVDADDNALTVEGAVPASLGKAMPIFGEGSDVAGQLPADSWLAIGQPDLGGTLNAYVDLFAGALGGRENLDEQFRASTGLDLQDDVLSWMGDFGIFVRGTSVAELDGALVIETKDEAKSARVIELLGDLARNEADSGTEVTPLTLPGGGEGVTLTSPEVPQPVHMFQRDGRVVLAYGDKAAEDALGGGEKLADSQGFKDAQASLGDVDLSFYLAFEQVFELAENAGAADDEGWQKAKPYLEPLAALAAGTAKDGDKLRSVFGLTFK